jgi:hypothetical protein
MEELLTVLQEYKGQLASLEAHLQSNPADQEIIEVRVKGSSRAAHFLSRPTCFALGD